MTHQMVVETINPAMSAIFAAGLIALWYFQRSQTYIAVLAATYAAKTLGFVIHFISIQQGVLPLRLVSNSFWLLAACLLATAIGIRFALPRRTLALATIATVTMALVAWFMVVQENIAVRIVVINLGVVGIFLLVAQDFSRRAERNLVEQFLLVQIVLNMLGFLLRPLSLLNGDAGDQLSSAYWLIFAATDIVLSTLLGLALFTVIALDVVDRLRGESIHDPLSGVLNRRGFEQMAAKPLRGLGAARPPVALVLSDLDHFKSINDRFGHAAGDHVIRAFGQLLKVSAPSDALVARIGGEEFAVLLRSADEPAARLFAENARRILAAAEMPRSLRPTASFGVAVARRPEDLASLIDRADKALYRAKREGRDRVRLSSFEVVTYVVPRTAAG